MQLVPVLVKFGFFGGSVLVGDVLLGFGFAGTAGGGFDAGNGGPGLVSSLEETAGGISSTKSLMKKGTTQVNKCCFYVRNPSVNLRGGGELEPAPPSTLCEYSVAKQSKFCSTRFTLF
jgi:hypothetical protein